MKVLSLSQDQQRKTAGQSGVAATPSMNITETGASHNPIDAPLLFTLRNTPGPDDPVWNAAPWLDELREVPPEGVWPRYMTLPHPAAVGTYGPEVEAIHAAISGGRPLRWWQRLAVARILEHDADGVLVWPEYLVTLARQVGKSWLMRAIALWRIKRGPELWGEQLVTHTGRDKAVVLEVARPALAWAEANGLTVSRNNGREGIGTGSSMETGSRWLLLAKDAVYGKSPTAGLVDEGWDVGGAVVDDGIVPAMVEQTSPQLGLFSTAHRKATGLMLDRRGLALAQVLEPVDILLLDWSTPADIDRGDRRGWRAASPHWSAAREKVVERSYRKVLAGVSVDPEEPDPIASFDAQWLNRWPDVAVPAKEPKDEPYTSEEAWHECLDAAAAPDLDAPLFVAVEDDGGTAAVAAAAALTRDGRVVVNGHRFGSRREAVDWAQDVAESSDDAIMLVGASLIDDAELEGVEVPIEPVGRAETGVALPLLRELVRFGRIAHEGAADATRAVVTARVRPGAGGSGILLTAGELPALLRCLAWATQRAHRDRA